MNVEQAVQKRLKELCSVKNIAAQELSRKSTVDIEIVNQILTDEVKDIPYRLISCLCNGLDISMADFFQSDLFRNLEEA